MSLQQKSNMVDLGWRTPDLFINHEKLHFPHWFNMEG